MRAAETAYSAEHHMASVNLIFDDEQTAYLRELSEKMNLDFGEFIPHATLINVTEQDYTASQVSCRRVAVPR